LEVTNFAEDASMTPIKHLLANQRDFFQTGKTKTYEFRIRQLKDLRDAILDWEDPIATAIKKDLNKSPQETFQTEIASIYNEYAFIRKHLRRWMSLQHVKTPLSNFPGSSYIYPEPYGVTLILAPWNYPFQLLFSPLLGAIAAGNCAILKPSEYASHTSRTISQMISKNFPPEFIAVVEGDVKISQQLLAESFDKIFFTGSMSVGRIVMHAAAEHLTPITLELGGKSPAIIHKDAKLPLAADRTIFAKLINAGQTCIAPDYVYVHKHIASEFLSAAKEAIVRFYGKNPLGNPAYPKIVNQHHFDRLTNMLSGCEILFGGQTDAKRHLVAPTLIHNPSWDAPIMQEEIFGPLLPIIEYDDLSRLIQTINQQPKSLTLYLFTENKHIKHRIIEQISAGGFSINNTIMHWANHHLPFGGVGSSGMGKYHGKYSFDTFSHSKSIFQSATFYDAAQVYYQPLTKWKMRILKLYLRLVGGRP
jgi:aldehyde dehydrogenase (NAD+)